MLVGCGVNWLLDVVGVGAFLCSFVDILLLFVIVFVCVSCGFDWLFAVGTGLNFECCLLRIVVGFGLIGLV